MPPNTNPPRTRKTRIVCISDTHNQTPKLPQGDILIHAGDLTKQGSYSELKKTAAWLEKTNFEAKIVIAGNHELTLDAPYYAANGSTRKWPCPQDPEVNRRLFTKSKSITYLENETAEIYLTAPNGPGTCLKVYGSPYVPNNRNWAFAYKPGEGAKLWDAIPSDVDVVVTHTPPEGHCDTATGDERTGCADLLRALHRVRPVLAVFGHIHEARGVERVRWSDGDGGLTEGVEAWVDPGTGKKQSLVDLTGKGGRPLGNGGRLTRQTHNDAELFLQSEGVPGSPGVLQPASEAKPTSSLEGGVEGVAGDEVRQRAKVLLGGAIECRPGWSRSSEVGDGQGRQTDVEAGERRESVMINAAFLGPHHLKPMMFNKPIVVDVDLPVWRVEGDAE